MPPFDSSIAVWGATLRISLRFNKTKIGLEKKTYWKRLYLGYRKTVSWNYCFLDCIYIYISIHLSNPAPVQPFGQPGSFQVARDGDSEGPISVLAMEAMEIGKPWKFHGKDILVNGWWEYSSQLLCGVCRGEGKSQSLWVKYLSFDRNIIYPDSGWLWKFRFVVARSQLFIAKSFLLWRIPMLSGLKRDTLIHSRSIVILMRKMMFQTTKPLDFGLLP